MRNGTTLQAVVLTLGAGSDALMHSSLTCLDHSSAGDYYWLRADLGIALVLSTKFCLSEVVFIESCFQYLLEFFII